MVNELLEFLKMNQGYVSGAELAQRFQITRAGIWKQIEHLRRLGYQIESAPHKGYKLAQTTTVLTEFEIRSGLATRSFGRVIHQADTVNSTNLWARSLAGRGATEGTLVIAETQTQGRGRLGRTWVSNSGKGLCFSLILRPKLSAGNLAGLTILAAVALAKAVKTTTGLQVQLKWPNDLVFEDRKLAGILAEVNGELEQVNYLILGIGLNVNQEQGDFLGELLEKATSLRLIAGRKWMRLNILQQFLLDFEQGYEDFLRTGLAEAIAYATQHSATLGRWVRIKLGTDHFLSGEAVELDRDGSLWVRDKDSKLTRIYAGELIEQAVRNDE